MKFHLIRNKVSHSDSKRPLFCRMTALLVLFLLCLSSTASIQIPDRPNPPHLINDLAKVFTNEQALALEKYLTMIDDSTSNQICVVTVANLNGYDKAFFATMIGREWGVGSKEHNNGIVILIKPKNEYGNGDVFIATGFGLEGAIPDAICSEIIYTSMIPFFKKNDYYTGVHEGCKQLYNYARKEYHSPRNRKNEQNNYNWFQAIIIIFVIVLIVSRRGFGRNVAYTTGGFLGAHSLPRDNDFNNDFNSSGNGFGGFGGGSFGGGGAGGSW